MKAEGDGGGPPRRRVTLRQELKEFTRRKIFDAALQCFAEKGYVNTTIDDIVTEAGTTRTSFYVHFKNKADLLTEMVHDISRGTTFSAFTDEGFTVTYDGVHRWVTRMLEYWRSVRVREGIFRQALEVEPELASVRAAEIDRYMGIIEEILSAAGRPPGGRRQIEAMLLFAQINRFFDLWSEQEEKLDNDLVASVMTNTLWRQLDPAAGQPPDGGRT